MTTERIDFIFHASGNVGTPAMTTPIYAASNDDAIERAQRYAQELGTSKFYRFTLFRDDKAVAHFSTEVEVKVRTTLAKTGVQ